MSNYKIKVNNESESREAQELFFKLGYGFDGGGNKSFITFEYMHTFFFFSYEDGDLTVSEDNSVFSLKDTHKEITIPQLRDMVAQIKNEQGLISGADALNDYSNAQVSYDFGNGEYKWFPLDQCEFSIPQILKGHAYADDSFSETKLVFRLKPRTITLNVEIPAPFEPKEGDYVYFLCSDETKGYAETTLEDTPMNWGFVQFGGWRTEEEIKQVVAALRGALK